METDAERLATFTGYDIHLNIVEQVEGMCKRHAAKRNGSFCTPTTLTFLQARQECSGQIYFQYEPKN